MFHEFERRACETRKGEQWAPNTLTSMVGTQTANNDDWLPLFRGLSVDTACTARSCAPSKLLKWRKLLLFDPPTLRLYTTQLLSLWITIAMLTDEGWRCETVNSSSSYSNQFATIHKAVSRWLSGMTCKMYVSFNSTEYIMGEGPQKVFLFLPFLLSTIFALLSTTCFFSRISCRSRDPNCALYFFSLEVEISVVLRALLPRSWNQGAYKGFSRKQMVFVIAFNNARWNGVSRQLHSIFSGLTLVQAARGSHNWCVDSWTPKILYLC